MFCVCWVPFSQEKEMIVGEVLVTRSNVLVVTKWLKLSFAADDPITQEDACPEDSNCPSECYCEGGTVDCSHRELKGKKKDGFY